MTGETPVHGEKPVYDTLHTPYGNLRDSRLQVITILLIRHAETVDNVHRKYAGTTNSPLTNHGVLQAQALATSLVRDSAYYITHIAASTLERAHQTATAIYEAALATFDYPEELDFRVMRCTELIERDFGSLEGKSYLEASPQLKRRKVDPRFFYQKSTANSTSKIPSSSPCSSETHYEAESHESLSSRANTFIDSYLLPLIDDPQEPLIVPAPYTKTIAIVSHGILLTTLFRELIARFRIITISPEALKAGFIVGKTPRWDNTGYTLLQIHSPTPPGPFAPEPLRLETHKLPQVPHKLDCGLVVKEINVTRHLKGLKRTGGGIGSARVDPKQRGIKDFLKSKARLGKTAAGVGHERDGDAWGLPPPPPPPPPQQQQQPFREPLASTPFSMFDSLFRTDTSTDYFPSSPPLEADETGGMYQVSDLF